MNAFKEVVCTDESLMIMDSILHAFHFTSWKTTQIIKMKRKGEVFLLAIPGREARVCGSDKNTRLNHCKPYVVLTCAARELHVCCRGCRRVGKKGFVGRITHEKTNELCDALFKDAKNDETQVCDL